MKLMAPDFWIELSASATTLAGIYLGSTTNAGAGCYLVSMVFWFTIMMRKKLWGILPLNVAITILSAVNFWRAVA
jgi:hypothetical protein